MTMRRSINLRSFPSEYTLEQVLTTAKRAGFDAVELNLEPNGLCPLTDDPEVFRAIHKIVARAGLRVSSVYSREQWSHPATSDDPERRKRWREIIRLMVNAASILESDLLLVVPGGVDTSLLSRNPELVAYETAYLRAQESIAQAATEVADCGVRLGVENVWTKFLLSPLEMRRFVDEIGIDAVGIYFDVGNSMAFGFPEDWIDTLGRRIFGVHFKDFRHAVGTVDGFVGLLQGDVNWPKVMASLRRVRYDGYMTAEVLPPYKFAGERLIFDTAAGLNAITEM